MVIDGVGLVLAVNDLVADDIGPVVAVCNLENTALLDHQPAGPRQWDSRGRITINHDTVGHGAGTRRPLGFP